MDSEVVSLPPEVREGVDRLASDWTAGGHVGRLWSRDAALWTGGDESRWLGWLDIAGTQLEHLGPLQTLQQDMAHGPFDHAVLFKEDRFLRVVGQRDKIELLARPFQMRGDQVVVFAVVVHIAAQPGQGGCFVGHSKNLTTNCYNRQYGNRSGGRGGKSPRKLLRLLSDDCA